jgi:hypothetical protein
MHGKSISIRTCQSSASLFERKGVEISAQMILPLVRSVEVKLLINGEIITTKKAKAQMFWKTQLFRNRKAVVIACLCQRQFLWVVETANAAKFQMEG